MRLSHLIGKRLRYPLYVNEKKTIDEALIIDANDTHVLIQFSSGTKIATIPRLKDIV